MIAVHKVYSKIKMYYVIYSPNNPKRWVMLFLMCRPGHKTQRY